MSNYMARIELREAGADDYDLLHVAMQRRGYLRTMTGEDGVTYQLPLGTYYVTESSANSEVALRAAVEAAKETGREGAIILTDWRTARWSGLQQG